MKERNNKGFTLVELMFVIGVIAILMGLVVTIGPMIQESARNAKCINNLQKNIYSGLITYQQRYGRYPDVPGDLLIFTHILSDPAAIVAQSSSLNTWTESLQSRDVFIQVNYVTLPNSIPAGTYVISIGAFQSESGLRLPVFDGDRVRGDRLFLYRLTVEVTSE